MRGADLLRQYVLPTKHLPGRTKAWVAIAPTRFLPKVWAKVHDGGLILVWQGIWSVFFSDFVSFGKRLESMDNNTMGT